METTASQDEMKGRTFSHIFSSIDRTRFIWGGPLAPLSTGALLSHRDTDVFPTVLSDPPIFEETRLRMSKGNAYSHSWVPCVLLLRLVNTVDCVQIPNPVSDDEAMKAGTIWMNH